MAILDFPWHLMLDGHSVVIDRKDKSSVFQFDINYKDGKREDHFTYDLKSSVDVLLETLKPNLTDRQILINKLKRYIKERNISIV